MYKKVAVLPGDGIGKEVTAQAVRVLQAVGEQYGHTFETVNMPIGGEACDLTGKPLPPETLRIARESDAILLGAVGGPKWDDRPKDERPEAGLLALRRELELYANLRPVKVYTGLGQASPLKPDLVHGVNFVIVRELTGGLYFGEPRGRTQSGAVEEVVDTLRYTRMEIERIVKKAFEIAEKRGGRLVSVDKANVLESSRMWREVAEELHASFSHVQLEHLLVDHAAMALLQKPADFDVIVTENMFGDILSDEASILTGSLGLLPSASLGERGPNLYEPVHGSAPDIAGSNTANPLAAILSVALMLRYSFGLEKEAEAVEKAVDEVVEAGFRTADIKQGAKRVVSTKQMTDQVLFVLNENMVQEGILAAYA